MENYRIHGQSREINAIGIFEPFIEVVTAESSHNAYNQIREKLYNSNRDHVLITQIELITDNGYVTIEPRAYL